MPTFPISALPAVRDANNISDWRAAIREKLGHALEDNGFGNLGMLVMLNRADIDALTHAGLLNRGYCPFCGIKGIDDGYGINHADTPVCLCKDCCYRVNPELASTRWKLYKRIIPLLWAVILFAVGFSILGYFSGAWRYFVALPMLGLGGKGVLDALFASNAKLAEMTSGGPCVPPQ
jgi:hypothetical protein